MQFQEYIDVYKNIYILSQTKGLPVYILNRIKEKIYFFFPQSSYVNQLMMNLKWSKALEVYIVHIKVREIE